MSEPRVALLTGTTGSGKTAVAHEIAYVLPSEGLSVAVIDLDCLGSAWLGPTDDAPDVVALRLKNLASVWPNFVATGVRHVVLSGVIQNDALLASVGHALRNVSLKVVRLLVGPDEIEKRLQKRDKGAVLEAHMKMAPLIERELDKANIHDLAIRNDNRTINQVATEILAALEWLNP